LDPREVGEMSAILFETLWLSITQIEAQDMLNKMFIADWPNLKKNERQKKHKDIFNQAFPKDVRPKRKITTEDLQRLLRR
jgi:hypothetical protein